MSYLNPFFMQIKPLKQKRTPGYPTLDWYITHPELLRKSVPQNWIKNKYAATALSAFILCGCPDGTKKSSAESVFAIFSDTDDDTNSQLQQNQKDSIKVAPIFAHGEGSGATGCVVMSPPVFISEDEACKIIFDKLTESGFVVEKANAGSINFKCRQLAISCMSDEEKSKFPKIDVNIAFDGVLKGQQIHIEYVSTDDYSLFAEENNMYSCSVTDYDIKNAAEKIREELVKSGKQNAVVFYDPIPYVKMGDDFENWNQYEKEAEELARKQLLAQVTDFINWMKKEGFTK